MLYEDMDDGPPSDHSEHDFPPVFSPAGEELVEAEILPEEVPAEVAEVAEIEVMQTAGSSTSSTEVDSTEEDEVFSRSCELLL